tara:strand:+ start:349 stop:783 length:435 start_codon:yes stop_codon:yes gene_type:complete
MFNADLMFSSKTDMWATPQDVFDKLNEEFNFNTDVCASSTNAKCSHYYTEQDNGLLQDWKGICFMNPPYGRTIGQWVSKAYKESIKGATIVCLLPSRTDTRWWHDNIIDNDAEVRFIKGRLKFGGHNNSAPFPSAIVIFRGVQE